MLPKSLSSGPELEKDNLPGVHAIFRRRMFGSSGQHY